MKTLLKLAALALILACGNEKSTTETSTNQPTTTTQEAPKPQVKASERIDLENKGVGPITSITLDPEIDRKLAVKGKEIFDMMCTACHKPDSKFIGPAPLNILQRRSPEWVMNMILNPDVMVKEDPLAKDLLMEFNGSPMADQNLNEDEARAILEYFRTL